MLDKLCNTAYVREIYFAKIVTSNPNHNENPKQAQSLLTLIVFLCYDLDKLGILMDLLSFWTLYTVKFEKAEGKLILKNIIAP